MAHLEDPITGAKMGVDAESRASRLAGYAPDGESLSFRSDRNRGTVSIAIQQSAVTAQGAVVWACRNKTAGKTIYIRRVWWQAYFSGTGQATEMRYGWRKGNSCTAITNGTYVIPALKRTSITNPDIEAKYLDTGLTLTGVVWDIPFYYFGWARLTHSAAQVGTISPQMVLDFGDQPFELAQNEVFSLYSVANSVIGDGVIGGVDFCGG